MFIPRTKIRFLTASCNSYYETIQSVNFPGIQNANSYTYRHAHIHHIITIKTTFIMNWFVSREGKFKLEVRENNPPKLAVLFGKN